MNGEGQKTSVAPDLSGPSILKTLEDLLIALRRSSKDLAFYPSGHPQLNRSLENAMSHLHAAVAVRTPLPLTVSRTGFSFEGQPVGKENRQLATMAAELFVRRIQQISFAQEVEMEELAAFLQVIVSDPKDLIEQGGPGKNLAARGVSRIQVAELDFRRVGATPAGAGRGAGSGTGTGVGAAAGQGGRPGTGGPGGAAGMRPGAAGAGTGGRGAAGEPGGPAAAAGPGAGPATPGTAAAGAATGVAGAGAGPDGTASPPATAQGAPGAPGAAPKAAEGGALSPGRGGSGGIVSPTKAEVASLLTAKGGALTAPLGAPKEQTVESLIQRLEREAVSGGQVGYEWTASRLETTAAQAVREATLKDVLAILGVFLRHQQTEALSAPVRQRAERAVETIATDPTIAYLVEHLRVAEDEQARDLSTLLMGLGPRMIPYILRRLVTEDHRPAQDRLFLALDRFHEVVQPDVTRAVQTLSREQASALASILKEIGGETSVVLLSFLLRHRDGRVRGEAIRGLGHIDEPSAHRALVQTLRDPDLDVLELAIGMVGAAKVKLATPTLLRLAGQRVLSGRAFETRKAAIAALGAMGDPATVSPLAGLLYTRTWFQRAAGDRLRLAAAQALLQMSRPGAREVVVAGSRGRRGDVRRACTAALRAAGISTPARG
jgi:hypothetical protein